MKSRKVLTCLLAIYGTASLAQGDTVVHVTGASAFRAATMAAIQAKFTAGGSYLYGIKGTGTLGGTNQAVFKGTFPGIAGTTVVRTSFNGSVEGLNSLLGNTSAANDSYIDPATLTGTPSASPTMQTGMTANQVVQGDIGFSDVSVAATPFAAQASSFQPASAGIGVVVFTMLKNKGAAAALTNVTNKQFQAVFTTGFQPLSLFTGNAADNTHNVYALGRNDGSGTRTTYMAESGTGITTLVQQYIGTASSGAVTVLQLANTTDPANISTIWKQNVSGNGGYASGSNLRDLFKNTTANPSVYLSDTAVPGADSPDFTGPCSLLTFLGISDAQNAIAGGATAVAFNGVSIDPSVSPLSSTDIAKIANGAYTAWGNEQMYRRAGLTTDQLAVDTALRDVSAGVPANIGAAGIPNSSMNVTRNTVGGVITAN